MKVSGITGSSALEQMLHTYTGRAEAREKETARNLESESLVDQLMPDVEEAAPEETIGREETVAQESGTKVELSDEVKQMQAEANRLKEELENAKEAGEAMGEAMSDVGKILAIFRRIAKGDHVPPQDEKKLMEYDPELYAAAKQLGATAQNEDPKRHKSVDSEEEQKAAMQEKIDALAAQIPELPSSVGEASAPCAFSVPSASPGGASVDVSI